MLFLIWDGSYSRAFENMVFIHLYQKWHRIHYYLTKKKRQEVDFIAVDTNGHPAMAVQACMDISREDTLNRELEPMISTAKYFGIKENLLITYNQEKDFHRHGVSVKAIPAWKWLLKPG